MRVPTNAPYSYKENTNDTRRVQGKVTELSIVAWLRAAALECEDDPGYPVRLNEAADLIEKQLAETKVWQYVRNLYSPHARERR